MHNMAYISTEEVAAIRNELKSKYGRRFKFSVKRSHHSGVDVTIVSGDTDFSSISKDAFDVNQYHVTTERYGSHVTLFNEIFDIIRQAPGRAGGREWFDKSDAMTDYFHTAYYFSLGVGSWNRPYTLTK
jgi:hypothetical protein